MFVDMARLTGYALRLEAFVGMAFFAGQRRVFSGQREARQIMVEQDPLLPCDGIVAAVAFVPQPFAVRIIIGMAANTCERRQFDFGRLFVTGFA